MGERICYLNIKYFYMIKLYYFIDEEKNFLTIIMKMDFI